MTPTLQFKQLHPQSPWYLVYLMTPWLLLGLIASLLLVASRIIVKDLGNFQNPLLIEGAYAIISVGFILLGLARLTYAILFLRSYKYEVKNGNLAISKGIFVKKAGSYPLKRITDIYIKNDWKTFLFGLYTLEVLTPSQESKDFSSVEGLTQRGAHGMKERLLKMIQQSDHELSHVRPAAQDDRGMYSRHSLVARRRDRSDVAFATHP